MLTQLRGRERERERERERAAVSLFAQQVGSQSVSQ